MAVDFFAHEPDAIYEPWTPAIGDRVRVVLNGECRVTFRPRDERGPHGPRFEGHPEEQLVLAGAVLIGTVVDPPSGFRGNYGHHCYVRYDTPTRIPDGAVIGCWYAACELEPLPADAPPERAEGAGGEPMP